MIRIDSQKKQVQKMPEANHEKVVRKITITSSEIHQVIGKARTRFWLRYLGWSHFIFFSWVLMGTFLARHTWFKVFMGAGAVWLFLMVIWSYYFGSS